MQQTLVLKGAFHGGESSQKGSGSIGSEGPFEPCRSHMGAGSLSVGSKGVGERRELLQNDGWECIGGD